MKPDIQKFSISEAHNDTNGKSSNSKMNGTVIIWSGCLSLLLSGVALICKIPDAASFAITAAGVIGVGATLSGYSKKKGIQQNKIYNQ